MTRRLAGVALAICLATSGCAHATSSATSRPSTSAEDAGAAATKSPAAELRSGLNYLLTEHTYLVGMSTGALLAHKGDLRESSVTSLLAALDSNSVRLATALTTDASSAADFLTSWRQQVRLVVEYAAGKAAGSKSASARTRRELAGFGASFGLLMSRLVPELPAAAVTAELSLRTAALLAVIDAQAAGGPDQYVLLQRAADLVPATATTYAQAIAVRRRLTGSTGGSAADLRAQLTSQLIAHVYDLSLAVDAVVASGGKTKAPRSAAALAGVDVHAVTLAQALGAVYPELEGPFLAAWRKHNGLFVSRALAAIEKDPALAATLSVDLISSGDQIGQLINSAVPQLPATTIAGELNPYVAAMSRAVASLVDNDGAAPAQLIKAASDQTGTAAILAAGIAANKRYG